MVYFIDSAALLVATFILIRTLNEDFGGTVLNSETRLLKILFGIFTIAYLGQTIFLLVGGAGFWRDVQVAKGQKAIYLRRNYVYAFTAFFDIFPILS